MQVEHIAAVTQACPNAAIVRCYHDLWLVPAQGPEVWPWEGENFLVLLLDVQAAVIVSKMTEVGT